MVTRMAPILAVANCTMVHSGQFGAQMPTRSPCSRPSDMRPRAITSISSLSSPYVHLRVLAMSTSASASGFARTVRSKFSPMVSSRIGMSVGPASYDFIGPPPARMWINCTPPSRDAADFAGNGPGQDQRMAPINPFRIAVPDADLHDLRARLVHTRWPEAECVDDWSQGIPLSYTRELADYWAGEYDWRAREAALNRFDQFSTEIDGL